MKWWLFSFALLALAWPLRAEPPALFLQTGHVAWRAEDDAPGNIEGIAQTPDGFLWLASGTGLYRFDGLTFRRITLLSGAEDTSLQISSLAAAPNGDVWVGYASGGIARYRAGRLERINPAKPSTRSVYLTVTHEGTLWARARGKTGSGLVRFANGRWDDVDERWNVPGEMSTMAMLIGHDGTLYLLSPDGLRQLRPGTRRFDFQPLDPGQGATIAEDGKGRLWLANTDHLSRVEMGKGYVGPVTPLDHTNVYRRLAFARNGLLWMGGTEDGVHLFEPDRLGERYTPVRGAFAAVDGLSSSITLSIFKDREDNVWLGTVAGLDRFATTRSVLRSNLPGGYTSDGLRTASGNTYLISGDDIYRVERSGPRKLASIPDAYMVCGDHDGLVVGAMTGVYRLMGEALVPIGIPPAVEPGKPNWLIACAEDQSGRLLISQVSGRVHRREANAWRPLSHAGLSPLLFVQGFRGENYVVYKPDTIARINRHSITPIEIPERQHVGFFRTVAKGRDCVLFGAQNGLLCLNGDWMHALSATTYPELLNVSGILEAPDGWTWVASYAGILRARTDELMAAFMAPGSAIHFERFGSEQSLRADQSGFSSRSLVADRYGRLWAFTTKGLVSIDMARADAHAPPPIVVIQDVTSNGHAYQDPSEVTLPMGTRSLQIDYTATALTDPKGTRFRYRLEGVDTNWTDAGSRRQAIYTNLLPGHYVFRVTAVSSAGMASAHEATLQVFIQPAFYQTWWFYVVLTLAAALTIWLVYRWRMRAMAVRIADRLQGRMGERERIARELHDTLLQGFQGLILRFQSVANRLPKGEALRPEMDQALDLAEAVLVEGRNRVRDLRTAPGNLSETLTEIAQEMAAAWPAAFALTVEGTPRALHAAVNDEIRCIGEEAIRNAFRHARARSIEAVLTYRARELRFHLRDDGAGLPADVLANGAREGHFGLVGMRERATRVGGSLTISSRANAGTEIVAAVPGAAAYVAEGGTGRWWIWMRLSGKSE
ncbi:sensor histidine kinase [Novosphingobium sp. AP12]|uniref:sensor histidine kinase n=1 Tax=Novosphingobium sp. AP12 TaxID=1144305 RepID=UPI000271E216|nr:sensor histidine kinase [Novosphingobium sp. AP12]EJL33395.1 Y-Y-Y domain-containing protein,histidine kinase [Novosphingobium sp. AP12]